jgi:hypothetical protein
MISKETFTSFFAKAYEGRPWPPPLKKDAGNRDALASKFAIAATQPIDDDELSRVKRTLGSLVNGQAAERAFERIYSAEMQTSEVKLLDDRSKRSDADYILVNGNGKHLFRLNIKLHGSVFRQAKDRVGLDPEDCFPLATYKINAALEKQDQQHLPYLFSVVTVPGLTAEKTGGELPAVVTEGMLIVRRIISSGKLEAEELFIETYQKQEAQFVTRIDNELARGRWFVFSARRANVLMKERLFERVFALRQRGFNRAFRNAEIDMHLSFAHDMLPIKEFLDKNKRVSASQFYSMIERGTI